MAIAVSIAETIAMLIAVAIAETIAMLIAMLIAVAIAVSFVCDRHTRNAYTAKQLIKRS